jgi:hypothetical protein
MKKLRTAAGVAACLGALVAFSAPALAVSKGSAGGGTTSAKKTKKPKKAPKPTGPTLTVTPSPVVLSDDGVINATVTLSNALSFAGGDVTLNSPGTANACKGTLTIFNSHGVASQSSTVDNNGNASWSINWTKCHPGTFHLEADEKTAPFNSLADTSAKIAPPTS